MGRNQRRRTHYSMGLSFPSTRIRHNPLTLASSKANNGKQCVCHVWGTWVIWGLSGSSWVWKTNTMTSTTHNSAESNRQNKMAHLELKPRHRAGKAPGSFYFSTLLEGFPLATPPTASTGTCATRHRTWSQNRRCSLGCFALITALSYLTRRHMCECPAWTRQPTNATWRHLDKDQGHAHPGSSCPSLRQDGSFKPMSLSVAWGCFYVGHVATSSTAIRVFVTTGSRHSDWGRVRTQGVTQHPVNVLPGKLLGPWGTHQRLSHSRTKPCKTLGCHRAFELLPRS